MRARGVVCSVGRPDQFKSSADDIFVEMFGDVVIVRTRATGGFDGPAATFISRMAEFGPLVTDDGSI